MDVIRRIIFFVFTLFLSFLPPVCCEAEARGRQALVVMACDDFAPYSFLEDGEIRGFDVDIVRAIAEAADVDVEIRLGNLSDILWQLREGRIDIAAGIALSRRKSGEFLLTEPYNVVSNSIFVRRGSSICTSEEIQGREILAQRDGVTFDYLISQRVAGRIMGVRSQRAALRYLLSGKGDCAVLTTLHARYFMEKEHLGGIRTLEPAILPIQCSLATSAEDRGLINRLNRGLRIIKTSGQYNQIYDRWFSDYREGVFSRGMLKNLRYGMVFLSIAVIFILAWSWTLRRKVAQRTGELERELSAHRREELRRQKAERSLLSKERKYRQLFQSVGDSIFIISHVPRDRGGLSSIVEANDTMCRILGYKRAELLKLPLERIFQEGTSEELDAGLVDLLHGGTDYFHLEDSLMHRDGKMIPVELNLTRLDLEGKVLVLAIARDITRRKRSEERECHYLHQLRHLASSLSVAEEKERCNVASQVHDFIGQSLASCKLKLQLLREVIPEKNWFDEITSVIAELNRSIQRTRTLTFELGSPVLYRLGIGAAINWLTQKMEEEHGLEIIHEDGGIPRGLDDQLKSFLFRALRELLMNVVKHARCDRARVVTAMADQSTIMVEVKDEGCGFNVAILESVDVDGQSFGLFSLSERLKFLGGRSLVRSEPGRGTTVTLFVPVDCFARRQSRRNKDDHKDIACR